MPAPLEPEPVDPKDDPRSVDDLIAAALAEPGEDSAWDAIWALRWRGTQEVFDLAASLMASDCAVERALGADILGQLGVPERAFPEPTLAALLARLDVEDDANVLASVLIALSHQYDPRASEPASRFRNYPDAEVRYAVVHALMNGHDVPASIAGLIELMRDPEPRIRDWACFGLGSLTDADTPAIRDALAARMADEDENTRAEAMLGLARRGDRRVVLPLKAELGADAVSPLEIEAAGLLADPCFLPELLVIRDWWTDDKALLDDAILACMPGLA